MPADDVVTDASPLLNLSLIDRLDLLETQFERVYVPEAVWDELTAGEAGLPALRSLRDDDVLSIVPVEETEFYVEIARKLDRGETAAIAYALNNDTDRVLLDERDARRVARRHDLEMTGVIGMLLRGAREGTVDLPAELDELRDAGFWISDPLYDDICEGWNG